MIECSLPNWVEVLTRKPLFCSKHGEASAVFWLKVDIHGPEARKKGYSDRKDMPNGHLTIIDN